MIIGKICFLAWGTAIGVGVCMLYPVRQNQAPSFLDCAIAVNRFFEGAKDSLSPNLAEECRGVVATSLALLLFGTFVLGTVYQQSALRQGVQQVDLSQGFSSHSAGCKTIRSSRSVCAENNF